MIAAREQVVKEVLDIIILEQYLNSGDNVEEAETDVFRLKRSLVSTKSAVIVGSIEWVLESPDSFKSLGVNGVSFILHHIYICI